MTVGRWRMRGLYKRKGSEVWQGRFRIPQHIWDEREKLSKIGIKVGGAQGFAASTGERDKAVASKKYRTLLNRWDSTLEDWETALASGPVDLSNKQAGALAGEGAVSYLRRYEDDPELAPKPSKMLQVLWDNLRLAFKDRWTLEQQQDVFLLWQELNGVSGPEFSLKIKESMKVESGARLEFLSAVNDLYSRYSDSLGWQSTKKILDQHGIVTSKEGIASVAKLRMQLHEKVLESLRGRIDLDYSEPDWIKNLPTFQSTRDTKFSDLLALWKKGHRQAHGTRSTVDEWQSIIDRFSKFLGHKDAARVSAMDVKRYCDYLLETLAPTTVKRKHLAAISSVFKVALNNQLLPSNPASEVIVKVPKQTRERSRAFTKEEAKLVLRAASCREKVFWGRMGKLNRLACQWVPWLCAYTGARAGEVAQLRKQDIQKEGDFYFIRITPDAGTVKSKQFREVPLHPHMVELGFLEFVSNCNDGPLFFKKSLSRSEPWKTPRDKVGKWVRDKVGITDKRIAPSHAWRHYFTQLAAEGDMDFNYRDAIRGHSDGSGASYYQEFPLSILYREICKLPRFELG